MYPGFRHSFPLSCKYKVSCSPLCQWATLDPEISIPLSCLSSLSFYPSSSESFFRLITIRPSHLDLFRIELKNDSDYRCLYCYKWVQKETVVLQYLYIPICLMFSYCGNIYGIPGNKSLIHPEKYTVVLCEKLYGYLGNLYKYHYQ